MIEAEGKPFHISMYLGYLSSCDVVYFLRKREAIVGIRQLYFQLTSKTK